MNDSEFGKECPQKVITKKENEGPLGAIIGIFFVYGITAFFFFLGKRDQSLPEIWSPLWWVLFVLAPFIFVVGATLFYGAMFGCLIGYFWIKKKIFDPFPNLWGGIKGAFLAPFQYLDDQEKLAKRNYDYKKAKTYERLQSGLAYAVLIVVIAIYIWISDLLGIQISSE